MDKLFEETHIRTNILTGAQVLVSPHRTKRPWQGKQEVKPQLKKDSYDPNCYLCPGNTRAGGEKNPNYKSTYSFTNDFSALLPNSEDKQISNEIFQAHSERGVCKVVCFSPDHSKSFSSLSIKETENVIRLWQKEFIELSQIDYIKNIQIFENKGAIMGCSNPHPHGQIWAQETIPLEIQLKTSNFLKYREKYDISLLKEYINQELKLNTRIIYENDHFVVLVPFWAVWPFETMIVSKREMESIIELTSEEITDYAKVINCITKLYDKLFDVPFPYSGGIHQAPVNSGDNKGWHWHMSFYPPLLRSATVKKFMVGYEMFGMPQRDITPEQAALKLKDSIAG